MTLHDSEAARRLDALYGHVRLQPFQRALRTRLESDRPRVVEVQAEAFTLDENGNRSAEASSIRLPPGVWPERLYVEGVCFTRAIARRGCGGELEAVVYRAEGGNRITIFND